MCIELIKQVQEMAEFIKRTGQKVIPVYPLKKRENAHSNTNRRLLLAMLMNTTPLPANQKWSYQPKKWREFLQKQAEAAGYQFIEIEE